MSVFEIKRHRPSDSPLTRHVDGQILDPGSLNWLRIESHQSHYLRRDIYLDGETQRTCLTGGKRVVMCPMSAGKLFGERLRCRPFHPWCQQFHCPLLDLDERLLRHIRKNQREVKDTLNGLRVTSFDYAGGRQSSNLGINWAEH